MKMKQWMGVIALTLSAGAFADPVWIDVRTLSEYKADHIEGANHVPYTDVEGYMEKLGIDKSANIYLYGRSGRRAALAVKALDHLGYTNVNNLGTIEKAQRFKGQAIAAE